MIFNLKKKLLTISILSVLWLCIKESKNERRNLLVGKYIADFYFVNILLYNNKKYVSNTSVKSVKKHNDGKKGDFK